MSRVPRAKSWESCIEIISDKLSDAYENAIVSLAVQQASEMKLRGKEVEGEPTFDNMRETYNAVTVGEPPTWWPKDLDRIAVQIEAMDADEAPDIMPARAFSPLGRDLGLSQYRALVSNMLRGVGTPFDGVIRVQLTRAHDRSNLGGFRGPVQVGSVRQLKQSDRERELMFVIEHVKVVNGQLVSMFQQSASVIHAGAAMVNAARGVNAGAPWMQDGHVPPDNGMPQWMSLGLEALGYAMNNRQEQQQQAQYPQVQSGYEPSHQIAQHHPGAIQQIPGPVDLVGAPPPNNPMQAPNEAWEAVEDVHGDYDGLPVQGHALLDEDEWEDEDEDSYNYEEVYEDEAPVDPLKGLSPEQVQAHVSRWIDTQPDKAKVRAMGLSLAPKLMG